MMLSDEDRHSLIIEEAKLSDSGLYTCKATTEYGETSSSADLIVLPLAAIEITQVEVKAEGRLLVVIAKRSLWFPTIGINLSSIVS